MGCLEILKTPFVINLQEALGEGKGKKVVLSRIIAAIPKIKPSPKINKPE